MAATPQPETRSPLTLLNIVPKEHEKAIKQAFYNTAANIFVLLACAASVAVYYIMEAFLRPLLWAVLCGAFLFPFKRSLTAYLRSWLNGLNESETPILVGVAVTPLRILDRTSDFIGNTLLQNIKLISGVCVGVPAVYVLWHFGPLRSIVSGTQAVFMFTYDLLGYFTSLWVWTIIIAYLVAVVFFWKEESRKYLKVLSIPVWLTGILHVATIAGPLRVPLLLFLVIVIIVGFAAELNEARKQKESEGDEGASGLGNLVSWFKGKLASREASPDAPTTGIEEVQDTSQAKTDTQTQATKDVPVTPVKAPDTKAEAATKPTSLPVQPGVRRAPFVKSKLARSPSSTEHVAETARSFSDQCFISLLWGIVLTRLWLHMWLILVLLPLPMLLWLIKALGYKLSSPGGFIEKRLSNVKGPLKAWIRERREVLTPRWIRGLYKLVVRGDKKIISVLEQSLDKATSVLFILLLLVGTTLMSVLFAVQVQQESMYLVKTTSNLLNNTLHPEMSQWLPNNDDMQKALDSMVGNAYLYGRNWIAARVRDLVHAPADNNTNIETQVLELWDRLYDSWLARVSDTQIWLVKANATSTSTTSIAKPGFTGLDFSNWTSLWDLATMDGFRIGDIIDFVKENIGTFLSVLESIWLVLKGNMSLVFNVLTSVLSLVFGGGTALLNFVLSSAIFLTTLFYLLAFSSDQYKPVEWCTGMSPAVGGSSGGSTFGQAVQDAVGGVFMASLKMAAFYGLYTWLTHTLFGVNIVFIPSALAAICAALPFLGTYLAAVPAILELWLVQGQGVLAILLLVCHLLPTYVVDTAIYSEIKGGHPYVTGLAIAGGMYWMGLEGAIFGPIILCCMIVLVSVYSNMIQPETPQYVRSHSIM